MKPSRISFRFARLGDMVGCARVFLASATDLARRQGSQAPTIRAKDMARSLGHLQTTDPRGFHVLDNIGAADVSLTPTEVTELNASVSAIKILGARLPDQVLVFSDVEAPPKK
jgi:hypothetical protein